MKTRNNALIFTFYLLMQMYSAGGSTVGCVQGMLQLMEDTVVIRCREADSALVEVGLHGVQKHSLATVVTTTIPVRIITKAVIASERYYKQANTTLLIDACKCIS